jgi:hypothetical protein
MRNQHGGFREGAGPPTAAQKALAGAHENIRKGKQSTLSFAPVRPREEPTTIYPPAPAPAPQIEPVRNDPPAAPPPAWQAEVDTQRAHISTGIHFGCRKKKKNQRSKRQGFVKLQMAEVNKKENLEVALKNVRKGLVWSPNPEVLNNSGTPLETCWQDFAKLLVYTWIPGGRL